MSVTALFVGIREFLINEIVCDPLGVTIARAEHCNVRLENGHFWLTLALKADSKMYARPIRGHSMASAITWTLTSDLSSSGKGGLLDNAKSHHMCGPRIF